jgi:hypothetical protein
MNRQKTTSEMYKNLETLKQKYVLMDIAPIPSKEMCRLFENDLYDLKLCSIYKEQKSRWKQLLYVTHLQFYLMYYYDNYYVKKTIFDTKPLCLGLMSNKTLIEIICQQIEVLETNL